jgi:hypothetical protein
MGLNSKITLGWNGQEYKVKMTQERIITVEELGIYQVNKMLESGQTPSLMRISTIVSYLLCEAGADATVKDVNDSIFGQGDTSADDIVALHGVIMMGIVAEPKKKPITRSPKTTKKKATKKK